MRYDLGYFDDETCRLEPIENPFVPKLFPCLRNEVLPMSPEWTLKRLAPQAGFEPATLRLTAVAARQRRHWAQKLGDASPVVRS